MITTKPYLIRAIHEWASDNSLTPQILVDATVPGVEVPTQYVTDGQIVLNLDHQAVRIYEMGNEALRLSARFGGQPFELTIPVAAVVAIYARENGQGLFFREPEATPPEPDTKADDKSPKPRLKVVK